MQDDQLAFCSRILVVLVTLPPGCGLFLSEEISKLIMQG